MKNAEFLVLKRRFYSAFCVPHLLFPLYFFNTMRVSVRRTPCTPRISSIRLFSATTFSTLTNGGEPAVDRLGAAFDRIDQSCLGGAHRGQRAGDDRAEQ